MAPNGFLATEGEQLPDPGPISKSTLSKASASFYTRLVQEAPHISGDTMKLGPISEIPWANIPLFKAGSSFSTRNLTAVLLAGANALLSGFPLMSMPSVILRTGKAHQPKESFPRMMSMTQRMRSWWEEDLSDVDSASFKNMRAVRGLHRIYGKAATTKPLPSMEDMVAAGLNPEAAEEMMQLVRKELEGHPVPEDAPTHLFTWNPVLPFSQYDLALTQFTLFGFLFLFPELFGVASTTEPEEMQGFLHYWAVVGRMLGLEDRFNLALQPDPELYRKLMSSILIPALKCTDERVICLQSTLITGVTGWMPLPVTVKGYLYITLKGLGLSDGRHTWRLMNTWDKLAYYFYKWVVAGVRNNSGLRTLFNWIYRHATDAGFRVSRQRGCPML